jgi:gas vesicle protein
MKNDFSKQAHKFGHDLEDKFQNDRGQKGNFLGGFLMGALLGAGVTLLCTPKKGEDVQHDLAEGWGQVKSKAGKWSEKAGEWVKDVSDTAKSTVNEEINKAKTS